jgi:hypothetical protein
MHKTHSPIVLFFFESNEDLKVTKVALVEEAPIS